MQAKVGQQVRIKGARGLWTITAFCLSPSQGTCARLWYDGRSRVIPLSKLMSKSHRPLETAKEDSR